MQICQYEDMQVLKELRLTLRHGTCNLMKIEIEQKCRLEKNLGYKYDYQAKLRRK